MFVELHILQNFAPSNLNRDETGAPKDCEFGGYRRARISSQCFKRAIRETFQGQGLLQKEHLAARTKRLMEELVRRFVTQGAAGQEAQEVAAAALKSMGLGINDDGKTQYLLFLGENEIAEIVRVCQEHWADLVGAEKEQPTAGSRSAKEAKKAGKSAVPADVAAAFKGLLNGGKAADLALFGRMLADLPGHNIDAACQVAHAISTNRVNMEFDFYTAVDDLKPDDTAGADMLGAVEFNSACFYRYANVDLVQLSENLHGDVDLARETLQAFLRSSFTAIPTGKQNSMAAQNPPSFVFAVNRSAGLWSLANAFIQPVRPTSSGNLVQNSIGALDTYWGKLTKMYGSSSIAGAWVSTHEEDRLTNLQPAAVQSVDDLIKGIVYNAVFTNGAKGSQK